MSFLHYRINSIATAPRHPASCRISSSNSALANYASDTSTIWVNQNGVRFADESALTSALATNQLFIQDEIYAIFDSAMAGDALEDVQTETSEENTGVFGAESIEGLAEALGIEPDALSATIEHYNSMIGSGHDDEFDKDLSAASKISEPPFFAFRQRLVAHGNIGGIEVSLKYEVTRADSTPIAGLYAVGTESNMNHREYAYGFTVPGGAMCQAVDSGRVAARSAAEYIGA